MTIDWGTRAKALLEQALAEIDTTDVIPTVTAALQALRIDAGEEPESTMDGYHFPGEADDESGCTCPPDLVERGGWASTCPVHGRGRSV